MQFRSGAAGAEFQPETVHQVDVFGPKPGRMGTQVEEHHVLLIFEHEFQRDGGARLGQLLPILANLRALFGGRQFGREAHHDARGLQAGGGLPGGVGGIGAGDHHQFDVFAGLFRQVDDFGEDLGLGIGEHLFRLQAVLARAGLEGADGEHHDVYLAGVGLAQDALQMLQAVGIAHGDQHVAGTHVDGLFGNFRMGIQEELLGFRPAGELTFAIVDVAELEDDEEGDGEEGPGNGRRLFGEHVDHGESKERDGDHHQAERDFGCADVEIERHFPIAVAGLLVAQHEHAERLHGETPDHAEGVGLAQHHHVATADQNGEQLQPDDGIDETRGGAVGFIRVAEPLGEHAILGHPVEHAVGADDGGVDRAGEDQGADQYDKSMEQQAERDRADQVHGKAADQVVQVLGPRGIRNEHYGEEGNQRGEDHTVGEDHKAGALQVLQLGVGDFAVDLGQGLLAAHGEEGVAQADHDGDGGDGGSDGALEPAERLVGEANVLQGWKRHRLVAVLENRDHAPDEQDHDHDGGDLHDAQRLLAGFVDADDVLAPEVDGDYGGEHRREIRGIYLERGEVPVLADLVDEAAKVEARADGADGAGEHVVEHQGGNGELGQRPAHSLVDHLIDAATHEHGAALDVDGAHRIGKQHDSEDEQGGGLADGGFGDAAGVVGAGGKIAQHDGGGPPERNEGQHDGGRDDDLDCGCPLVGLHGGFSWITHRCAAKPLCGRRRRTCAPGALRWCTRNGGRCPRVLWIPAVARGGSPLRGCAPEPLANLPAAGTRRPTP